MLYELLDYFNKENDLISTGIILGNIGYCHFKMGKLSEALTYLMQSADINKKNETYLSLIRDYQNIGNTYFEALKSFKKPGFSFPENHRDCQSKTLIYLDSSLHLAIKFGELKLQSQVLNYKSDFYRHIGDFKSSLTALHESNILKDSILNTEKSAAIVREEKRIEMEALQQSQQLAQLKAQKQKSQIITLSSFLVLIIVASIGLFFQYRKTRQARKIADSEKEKSNQLLLNILPAEVAEELKNHGASPTRKYDEVTIIFSDFVNFTKFSERMSPEELIAELDYCFSKFDEIMDKYDIEKIKTIGDAYMAAAGLPAPCKDHYLRCCKAALEMREFIANRKKEGGPFDIRIGIHSGSIIAGIVGQKKYAYDIWGDTVNMAARMEQNSVPGKINISEKVYQHLKGQAITIDRGQIDLKNKGLQNCYFLESLS